LEYLIDLADSAPYFLIVSDWGYETEIVSVDQVNVDVLNGIKDP
jgi:hypothetical protein